MSRHVHRRHAQTPPSGGARAPGLPHFHAGLQDFGVLAWVTYDTAFDAKHSLWGTDIDQSAFRVLPAWRFIVSSVSACPTRPLSAL